jgi:hypothetical protein
MGHVNANGNVIWDLCVLALAFGGLTLTLSLTLTVSTLVKS